MRSTARSTVEHKAADLKPPPRLAKLKEASSASLGELLAFYIDEKLEAKEITVATAAEYRKRMSYVERRAPTANAERKITRQTIVDVREAFRSTAPTGNNVIKLIRAALRHARDTGRIEDEPEKGVALYSVRSRRRKSVSTDEARIILLALDITEQRMLLTALEADYFRLALLLGLRQVDLRSIRAVDVDGPGCRVRAQFKGERHDRHWLSVGPHALAILVRRASVAKGEGPIFATLGDITIAWQKVLDCADNLGMDVGDADGKRIRPHILRCANIDLKDRVGGTLEVIAASVRHRSTKTTRGYMGDKSNEVAALQVKVEQLVLAGTMPPQEGHKEVEKADFVLTGVPAKQQVGALIRTRREQKKWTVEHAARVAEVSVSCWKNWESGRIDSIRKLRKVGRLLGFEVSLRIEGIEMCEAP